MATIVETCGWENAQLGKYHKGDVQSENYPSGKCPVGEVSVQELSFREVSAWDLPMRNFQLGNISGIVYM